MPSAPPLTVGAPEPITPASAPVEGTRPAKHRPAPVAAIQPPPEEVPAARPLATPRVRTPDPTLGLFRLGVLYQQAGDHRRAVDQYRALLAIDARHVPALNNLAVSLRHLGALEEAADLLRRATALDPTYDMAFTNLGVVHQLQERSEAAIEAHMRALAINGRNWESAFNLGLLFLEADDLARAGQFLLKVVSLRPHASAYYHLGLIAERQGRPNDALHRYRQALEERQGAQPDIRAEAERSLWNLLGQARR